MKIQVLDIETIKGYFLCSVYNPETKEFIDFSINKNKNDLYGFMKFMETEKESYFVTFNGIGFDMQVIEYIYKEYHKWYDKSNLEITELIWQFAQDLIENQNYGLFLPFRDFSFKTIDIPRVFHWFNENRRVSLKQAEFEMRWWNIENFEIDHKKIEFTEDEIQNLIFYCHNDVFCTYELYRYCTGNVSHSFYKGKDKLKDRAIIQEEVGLDCLNWDDVKIGAEWNKKDYLELTKKNERDLKPTKVEQFYGKKFKNFFPKTVEFKTPELKKFVKEFGETIILNKKQEFKHVFNNDLTVTLAKGGIHSNEKNRLIKPKEDEYYIQCDIGSQYPNAIRKYGIYPKHLGKEWNEMLKSKIQRRLHFKSLYKQTKEVKYNSLQEMGKLSLNGGAYGRLNTKGDWQEDPCAMLKVTIGCQLEILMTVELMLQEGYQIVSCNTDGYDLIVNKKDLNRFFELSSSIEQKIGNTELGQFEYTVFEWIAQTSVNDYVARKIGEFVNGEFKPSKPSLKTKGDFEYEKELHKNTSFSILPLAYQKYFDENIDPEDFINNHSDIFDFCARSNSGSTYYHEAYKNNQSYKLPKLIRYYVSKDGVHIKKIVKDEVDTNANDTNVQPAEELKTVCNKLPKEDYEKHLSNVNRKWYINKVKETIFAIENGYKPKKNKIINKNQMSLF